jgi:hypothetical protein
MSTEVKVKQEVLDMAAKIEALMKSDKAGIISEANNDVFEKTLPEDLDLATVNRVHDHETTFIAGAVHYVGQTAIGMMAEDKDLKSVTSGIKMAGRNSLNVQIDRTKEYTNHLSGNGEKTVKYGAATIAYDVRGSKKSGGQLKAVTQSLAELAMSQLK